MVNSEASVSVSAAADSANSALYLKHVIVVLRGDTILTLQPHLPSLVFIIRPLTQDTVSMTKIMMLACAPTGFLCNSQFTPVLWYYTPAPRH
jgi:hypothetical protein